MGCQNCKENGSVYANLSNQECSVPSSQNYLLSDNERRMWMKAMNMVTVPRENFNSCGQHEQGHPSFKQIKKDIVRTFPNSQFFTDPVNLHRFQMLLKNFAVHFPKIGYTQGLNLVAGYLLLAGFNDFEAFEFLTRICLNDKLMMIGAYQDQFPLIRFYCALFWKLFQKKMPKLAHNIKKAQVPDEIWIFQWFISFFLSSFPVNFVKKLFNFIVCKKELAPVLIALGLVKCLKKDLQNLYPDEVDFFQYFNNFKNTEFCESKIDFKKVFTYANSVHVHELNEAIEEISLPSNFYAKYFNPRTNKKQLWLGMMRKLSNQRESYKSNAQLFNYKRDINTIEHIEKLIREKSSLYKSKSQEKLASMFRSSSFTIGSQVEEKENMLDLIGN